MVCQGLCESSVSLLFRLALPSSTRATRGPLRVVTTTAVNNKISLSPLRGYFGSYFPVKFCSLRLLVNLRRPDETGKLPLRLDASSGLRPSEFN